MTTTVTDDTDQQDFDGDLAILGLLRAKIFRNAINLDHKLDDMPQLADDLEQDIAAVLQELDTAATRLP